MDINNEILCGWKEYAKLPNTSRVSVLRFLEQTIYVSSTQFVDHLKMLIERQLRQVQKPVALLPIVEMKNGKTVYNLRSKNMKPNILPANALPGSEGIVANVCKQLIRHDSLKQKYCRSSSLRNLRLTKCHEMFLIDDFIGTGNRVCEYLDALYVHKTIRSWHSYKLLKITVLCYAGTKEGISKIEAHSMGPKVKVVLVSPSWNRNIIDSDSANLEKLFRRDKLSPMGYGNVCTNIIFEHGVPNNFPAIFWRGSKAPFPNRVITKDVRELFTSVNVVYKKIHNLPPKYSAAGCVLLYIRENRYNKFRLQSLRDDYQDEIALLNKYGYLKDDFGLSIKGKCEADRMKKIMQKQSFRFDYVNYIPKS